MSKMSEKQARRIVEEAAKRAKRKRSLDAEKLLFQKQRDFVQDTERLVAAKCSRRAGKSHSVAFALLDAGFRYPKSNPIYVTLAREKAKQIIWPALQELDDQLDLGLDFKHHTGEVRLPNGSIILISGAGSIREIDKCRGPKYPLVAIDEAQVFPKATFDYMVDEVFRPATLDYLGTIMATGTPNASCAGAFFDICTGKQKGWSVHEWTLRDNPHLFKARPDLEKKYGFHDLLEQELLAEREKRGWSEQHPGFLREYCGMWVRDSNALVFDFNDENVYAPNLSPSADWMYTLGVDVGFNDPMAFVVLASSPDTGEAVVVESYTEDHMIPSEAAIEVDKLLARYPISEVAMDTGGIGKGYAEEMKKRYGLPIEAVKKTEKATYLEFLSGDIRTQSLKVLPTCRGLIQEMKMIQWDAKKKDRGILEFDRNFPDHQVDALLYAWRHTHHSVLEARPNRAMPGTPEYVEELQKEMDDYHLFPGPTVPWWINRL